MNANNLVILSESEAAAVRTRLEKIGAALAEFHSILGGRTRKPRKPRAEPTEKAAKGKRGRPPKAEGAKRGPGRPPKAAAAPAAPKVSDEI